jgi:hypothetical protein
VLNNTLKPNNPTAKDMLLVSMGTGIVETPYLFADFKNANKTKWIKPLIDIMMNGNSETGVSTFVVTDSFSPKILNLNYGKEL